VSALLIGRLANFSSERLMRLLTRLGQDVEIVVKSTPRRRQRGRIRVVQEAVTAALKQVVTEKDRSALARRLKRGRVVYQSDPPGSRFTERIEPDGTRTLGRLMNRRFVPRGQPVRARADQRVRREGDPVALAPAATFDLAASIRLARRASAREHHERLKRIQERSLAGCINVIQIPQSAGADLGVRALGQANRHKVRSQ